MPLNASFFHGQIENGQNRFSPSGGWINNNADIANFLLHSNFYFDPILLLCQSEMVVRFSVVGSFK